MLTIRLTEKQRAYLAVSVREFLIARNERSDEVEFDMNKGDRKTIKCIFKKLQMGEAYIR